MIMMFPAQYYVMASKNIYHSARFVNEYILTFVSHNQDHTYGFSAFRAAHMLQHCTRDAKCLGMSPVKHKPQ